MDKGFFILFIFCFIIGFMKKKISILGSTGSIGTQALEVIEKNIDKFEIISLAAGNNIEMLKNQIKKFNPKTVSVANQEAKNKLNEIFPDLNILINGLDEIASDKQNDMILVSVSGKVGLKPTIKAIENGIDIALANKETLVMAGEFVMNLAKKHNVKILPVDSEHSAIHQCIKNIDEVEKLIITASGGPFLNKNIEEIKTATVNEALAHPRWNMGKKITVDSATLMNKGLEVIEAHHLFGFDYSKIEVIIHPQSYIHSAVEYKDGSIIAQIGVPSMHIPIQYAITYPQRIEGIKSKSFNFIEAREFDFYKPDLEKFPCLKLAYNAGKIGKSNPICMNAANEEAVFAFLDGKINLYDIYTITEKMLENHNTINPDSIDEIFAIDNEIRIKTKEFILNFSHKN